METMLIKKDHDNKKIKPDKFKGKLIKLKTLKTTTASILLYSPHMLLKKDVSLNVKSKKF